ncbi:MAG: DUF4426 domain-containing protein [Stenotrophobium sp.]
MKFRGAMLLAAWLLQTSVAAAGEPVVRSNGYVVRYAALASTGFTAEVARQYGITRQANHGVLIINVQRQDAMPGKSAPLPATATGKATSLMGDSQDLQLRSAPQSGTQDLLADFEMINSEYLRFDVDVLPQGSSTPIHVHFEQQFYNDRD